MAEDLQSKQERLRAEIRELERGIREDLLPDWYIDLASQLVPMTGIDRFVWQGAVAQKVHEILGLAPSEFRQLKVEDRIAFLRTAVEKLTKAPSAQKPTTADETLTPEVRAILFVNERLKTTGKLPSKTAIAKALDVDRRTLDNWRPFKVACAKLKKQHSRIPPKGTKSKDGDLEAWRESGK